MSIYLHAVFVSVPITAKSLIKQRNQIWIAFTLRLNTGYGFSAFNLRNVEYKTQSFRNVQCKKRQIVKTQD